jgi:uric acid transporter
MLKRASFDGNHNLLIVAVALSFGLIPVIQPSFYLHFPQNFQVIFGSSITSTVIVVFVLNLVFNHWHLFPRERAGNLETALQYGAVAPKT